MEKTCKISGKKFIITDSDIEFYKKMGVPSPTLCPDERQRRRLSFQNMYNLYHRDCSATGKKIITDYSPDSPLIIYSPEYWWSDKWDATKFGLEFNFSQYFFIQFQKLLHNTPLPALTTEFTKDENSDFTNYAGSNKNCYLVFHADMNRDCYFATGLKNCESCIDNFMVFRSELLFQCIDCRRSYNLQYSSNCENCSDSLFLKNCIGCKNCFFSTNLRNKEYFIYNKFVGKEKFEKVISQINFGNKKILNKIQKDFLIFIKNNIHPYRQGYQNQDCSGDNIFQCKEVHQSFDIQESENMKFCSRVYNGPNSDCYDIDQFGMKIELIYEGSAIGTNSRNVISAHESYGVTDSQYCYNCFHSENIFGCIGLKNAKYCILNKQYTKEEYFILRDKIIEHMKQTGEWGEFFPTEISPFAYNQTVAQEYFPLTKQEALNRGYKWKEEKPSTKYQGPKIKIPETISETSNEILKQILTCELCKKNYRIVKPEFDFYKKMNIPIPHNCPNCRHLERAKLRNPRKLFSRKCDNCATDMQTTFSPERPEKVFCEKCYLEKLD